MGTTLQPLSASVPWAQVRCATLETVISMERDKLVWTSRVKQMCLSVVLISWKKGYYKKKDTFNQVNCFQRNKVLAPSQSEIQVDC